MPERADVEALLRNTAEHGFLQAPTVAAVIGLEERLLLELLNRLGGEVHFPDFAEALARGPVNKMLEAELGESGTYVLRLVDA